MSLEITGNMSKSLHNGNIPDIIVDNCRFGELNMSVALKTLLMAAVILRGFRL
ncbi:hypothetical protein AOG1_20160 [Geobacter sp. AOG1]|nr:hypothetical protein AOG1_20160 [Geobacter sp. AOG1]